MSLLTEPGIRMSQTSGTTRARKQESNQTEQQEEETLLIAPSSDNNGSSSPTNKYAPKDFSLQVMAGLAVAGVASSLLTSTFGMFHVDVFLRAYQLPLTTYARGNVVFAVINTANDVAGAWILDQTVASSATLTRSDLLGLAGCLFCLCFLTPFFRSTRLATPWDGVHFVSSLSLYDTMWSFTAILLGSVVTDNHHLPDSTRVAFLASTKVANLLSSFAVTRMGLALFDVDNLYGFRVFLVALAMVVALLFLTAQLLVWGGPSSLQSIQWRKMCFTRRSVSKTEAKQQTSKQQKQKRQGLAWRQVVKDFWSHPNFRAWIGMEMLLEAQTTFTTYFLKTFVDQLIMESGGVSRETCDWFLSLIRPLTQIVGIAIYLPIRRFGYPSMYRFLFAFNMAFSLLVLFSANASSTRWILAFLVLYPVLSGAVQGAGFHLAMADMVMEMKRKHMLEGRLDEPSLAGLFMGANALMCKPMESFLPIITATVMDHTNESKSSLFYVLVIPPLVFSCLQLMAWSHYDLTPQRTDKMRDELKQLELSHSSHGDMEKG